MKIKSISFALIAVLFAASCATTATTDSQEMADVVDPAAVEPVAEAQAAAEVELDPNEEICKRIAKTGTRQKTKVCATRREWELTAQRAREETEKMQRRPQQGPVTN